MIKQNMNEEIKENLDLCLLAFELQHKLNKYDRYPEATLELLWEAEEFRNILKQAIKQSSKFLVKQKETFNRRLVKK